MIADLKTAAEVRAHAREVQKKINERNAAARPEPSPVKRTHPYPTHDIVPEQHHDEELPPQLSEELRVDKSNRARAALTIAAIHFGLTLENLQTKGGGQQFTLSRQIGCFVAKRLGVSYKKIAFMARRDHTTVLYSCKLVRHLIPRDPSIARVVDSIGIKTADVFNVTWRSVVKRVDP